MTQYDLVVCDLDGTLLNSSLQISRPVREAIHRVLNETQTRVVLATGRMHPSAVPFAKLLGISDPIITYGGGMVRQPNGLQSILYHQPVPLEVAKQVLGICRDLQLHLNVYINDKLYTEAHPHYVALYQKTAAIQPNIVECMEKTLLLPPTKLVIIEDDQDKMRQAHEALQATFDERTITQCQSRPYFLEVTKAGVNKWSAIQELASLWRVPAERIICIGDEGNDTAMIRAAGLGVAMGNAPDFVKQQADLVAPPIDRDGVAAVLQEYILQHITPVRRQGWRGEAVVMA